MTIKKKPIPAVFSRMQIVISGIAERTTSAVNSMAEEMLVSGISKDVIKAKILGAIQSGPALAEFRSFATAKCPGFVGEMTFRFARDTLAVKQTESDARTTAYLSGQAKKQLSPEEKVLAEDALEIWRESGVDTSAFQTDEMPSPPIDEDLDAMYMWVAVEDGNTCEVCSANHGEFHTLGEWSEIGEPRSGACAGDQNCRCVLVPVQSLTEDEQQQIKDAGPINVNE